MQKDPKFLIEEIREHQMKAVTAIDEFKDLNPEYLSDIDTLRVDQMKAVDTAAEIQATIISEGGEK